MAKGRTYIYLGPELGEKREAIEALRSSLGGRPEEYSAYAGEERVGDFVSRLLNGSLFADARLFQLKNAEAVKKKDEVDALLSYIAKPQDDTVLVLVSDETSIDKRLEGAVPKDCRRVFWELFEDRKAEWVSSFFRREGFRIEPEAVESVLELVENNTEALRRECSRLALFLEKGAPVRAEDVEACLSHTREESAFTLFSRIAEGDLVRALETARALTSAKEAPAAILAGLAWCFRRLGDYVALADAGMLNDFELRKAGLASKKAQKDYAAAASRYGAAGVQRCVALLADFDIAFRSSGAALEDALLDLFVCKLAAGGRPLERIDEIF